MTFPILKRLLDLESPMHNSYLSTLACSSSIQVSDGQTKSRYCKRMWCGVCAPIRTGVRMNLYKDILHSLGDLQLTTLTIPNCTHDKIIPSISLFRSTFRQFRNTYKKRTGSVFRGVYNFEVTYNHKTNLYHPHIHIIHECIGLFEKSQDEHSGKYKFDFEGNVIPEYKNELCEYWLDHCPQATIKAQDSRVCFDLAEGFKYQSKSIFKIKVNGKFEPIVPIHALDMLYRVLKGVRCFQAFGINKPAIDEDQEFEKLVAYETDKPDGEYRWFVNDWQLLHDVSINLSDYVPTLKQQKYNDKLYSNIHYKPPS